MQVRLDVLSKISTIAGSLDPAHVLSAIARILVPELADWSVVDVLDGEDIRRAQVFYRGPEMADAAQELRRMPSLWRRDPWVASRVLSGHSVVLPELSGVRDTPGGRDFPFTGEQLALFQKIAPRSELFVPLVVRGETVAVLIAAMTAASGRHYGSEDLALAEEVARRAAQIVENARLHQELKVNEARFRMALDQSNIVLYEQDLRGRFRWMYNPQLGYTVDDILGRRLEEVDGMRVSPTFEEVWQRVLQTGERVRTELRIVRGAELFEYLIDSDLIVDETGAITGIKGAATNITEHRRTERQLAQARELQERLAGVLGHDLRTPLSAVALSAALLLRRDDLDAEVRRQVTRIDGATRRMTEMINTLLDFTRSRQGTLPIARRPTDLAEVIGQVVDELRTTHPDHAIEVTVDGDTRGEWDPARLEQALCNLIVNALVHGDPTAPVEVRARSDGGEVMVEVHNQGPPIPAGARATLFEPFRRGTNSQRAERTGGLGLGLYIVRQIVLAHHGTVEVESDPRDGTRFVLRLPRGPAAEADLAPVQADVGK